MLDTAIGSPAVEQFHTHESNQDLLNLQFSQVNFNRLVYEVLRLRQERTINLITLEDQKSLIIKLYQRLNVGSSPLKIAG